MIFLTSYLQPNVRFAVMLVVLIARVVRRGDAVVDLVNVPGGMPDAFGVFVLELLNRLSEAAPLSRRGFRRGLLRGRTTSSCV